jgi:ketosteroid isomerase-like protein
MSQENVERVRQVFALFRNRDTTAGGAGFGQRELAAAAEIFHPEFELDATRAPMPDLRGTFRGLADVLDFWTRWLEAWQSLEFEEKLTDAGDHVLATIERQTMLGKGSGVEVEFPPYWQVFTFRDGLVVRQAFFPSENEALEAAGLQE